METINVHAVREHGNTSNSTGNQVNTVAVVNDGITFCKAAFTFKEEECDPMTLSHSSRG